LKLGSKIIQAKQICAGLATASGGQVPDVSMATTDTSFAQGSRILQLTKQLDKFRENDRFLGKFRMLGRTERRQGGAHP
jgi:hypothetical protein